MIVILAPSTIPFRPPLTGQESAGASQGAVHDASLAPARRADVPLRSDFEPGVAEFTLQVNEWEIPYRFMAVTALPGENLAIEIEDDGDREYRLRFAAGAAETDAAAIWTWTAPSQPGVYALRVERVSGAGFIHLNVFVMRPRSEIVNGSA